MYFSTQMSFPQKNIVVAKNLFGITRHKNDSKYLNANMDPQCQYFECIISFRFENLFWCLDTNKQPAAATASNLVTHIIYHD